MSQNKEALIEELNLLKREIENMREIYKNDDNDVECAPDGIDSEERAHLELMQKEIDKIAAEIESIKTSPAVVEASVGQIQSKEKTESIESEEESTAVKLYSSIEEEYFQLKEQCVPDNYVELKPKCTTLKEKLITAESKIQEKDFPDLKQKFSELKSNLNTLITKMAAAKDEVVVNGSIALIEEQYQALNTILDSHESAKTFDEGIISKYNELTALIDNTIEGAENNTDSSNLQKLSLKKEVILDLNHRIEYIQELANSSISKANLQQQYEELKLEVDNHENAKTYDESLSTKYQDLVSTLNDAIKLAEQQGDSDSINNLKGNEELISDLNAKIKYLKELEEQYQPIKELDNKLAELTQSLEDHKSNNTFSDDVDTLYQDINDLELNTKIAAHDAGLKEIVKECAERRKKIDDLATQIKLISSLANNHQEKMAQVDAKIINIIREKGGVEKFSIYINDTLKSIQSRISTLLTN